MFMDVMLFQEHIQGGLRGGEGGVGGISRFLQIGMHAMRGKRNLKAPPRLLLRTGEES